jgi:UDP-N-acetylglucosamine--N-acetylmuramyl-(pentapeptide) pyrophosphoryl-undecaprenol N-acetylglucosamine transferase
MSSDSSIQSEPVRRVAIACGGTGGHLFPGMAVGAELLQRECEVTLLISPKEVDQEAARSATGMRVETLPAVGLTRSGVLGFAVGCWKSYRKASGLFQSARPDAVLAMGGFTSAPPVMAGRALGAKTFLHEANSIPGRANRWLSRVVDGAFVYFPETVSRLPRCKAEVVGMPVRSQFLEDVDPVSARMALGLDPDLPVLLVMGGSQGARGVNNLVLGALPMLAKTRLQVLHLTGTLDFEKVKAAYASIPVPSVVKAFLSEMDLALGAATVAVSRAGASSAAELAAMKVPAILIPLPTAADNHQYFNAKALADSGAVILAEQGKTTPDALGREILKLLEKPKERSTMQAAWKAWHHPDAAARIAAAILASLKK